MKKRISILIIVIMMISSISYGQMDYIGIEDDLRSYILADFETGEILEEYNINEVVEIASTSKLMTYLVIMDEVEKGNISLSERIEVDREVARIGGSTLKLEEGEIFTIRELMEASLVVSANDATYALARHVGGTEKEFASMMNMKSRELGLRNAYFYNSTGLPVVEKDVQNVMTTKELFILSKHIVEKYPQVLEITKIPIIQVKSRDYIGKNTNGLLKELKEVDGLKTGFTNKAGYCYVSTFNMEAEENKTKDLRLISIVMGADSVRERNRLGKELVEYGMKNYSNRIFFDESSPVGTIEVPSGSVLEVQAFPREGFSKLIKKDEAINVRLDINEGLKLPIKKENTIGKAIVEKNNETIFETDIILKEDIRKASIFSRFGRYFSSLYDKVLGAF